MQTARLDGVGRTSYSLLCLPTASLHKLLSGLLRELVFPPHNCLSSSRTPQKQSNITPAQSSWVQGYLIRSSFDTKRISESLLKTKSYPGGLERQCSAVISSLGSLDEAGNSEEASVGWVNGKKSWGRDRERKREAVCEQLVESRCLLSCTTLMILCSHWYCINVSLLAGDFVLKGIRKEWKLDHATPNPRNVWMSCYGETWWLCFSFSFIWQWHVHSVSDSKWMLCYTALGKQCCFDRK